MWQVSLSTWMRLVVVTGSNPVHFNPREQGTCLLTRDYNPVHFNPREQGTSLLTRDSNPLHFNPHGQGTCLLTRDSDPLHFNPLKQGMYVSVCSEVICDVSGVCVCWWRWWLWCFCVAFGRLLNHDYVTFMHVLLAAQKHSHPDYKVSSSHTGVTRSHIGSVGHASVSRSTWGH